MRAPLFLWMAVIVLSSCNNTDQQKQGTKALQSSPPSFTISLKPAQLKTALSDSFPFLQSFAWARQGNKILLLGGRIQGFHGRTGTNIFPEKKANGSVWVIDLSDFSYHGLALDKTYPQNLQFFSSNMEFFQDGDTLYMAGGYGPAAITSSQSNHTFDRMVALSVSKTIRMVESRRADEFATAPLASVSSSFLKVAGGELVKNKGIFYLMFGQNFEGAYNAGKTGIYTNAIRQFRLNEGAITDTSSYIDSNLRRRDLPLATVIQPNGLFYAAFGGVFSKDGDGFANPVYINPDPFTVRVDTVQQLTNNYDCAIVSIYDPSSTTNINILLGGIGKYQYDAAKQQWQHGDGFMLLPFVRSITQMQFQNGVMKQYIQLPPLQPEMPGFLGANAVFFPHADLMNSNGVIDYSKIVADTTSIGYMYGGIRSLRPTSTDAYPTSVNRIIYEVFLNKNSTKAK